MCGIWTQEEWREAANSGSQYHLVGEYQQGDQTALMVAEGEVEKPDFVWNVYSNDGKSTGLFITGPNQGGEAAMEQAIAAMKKRGFTQVDTAGEVPVQTPTEPEGGVVRVQGKTIAEWKEEGRLNNDREAHVHPHDPEGEPNEDEVAAFEASLSDEEKEFIELSALVNAMGLASVFA